jgi:hypothetical protein
MEPEVVQLIRKIGLDTFAAKYAIKVSRHPDYPHLVHLKYSQLDSPTDVLEVRQCRGLILDEDRDYKPVCFPYVRFANHLEQWAAKIDWSTARVYDKLDGSLCCLWFYDGKWHVSTSGTPDASGKVMDWGFTFKELFWRIWGELGYNLPEDVCSCFMFELLSPYNALVCEQKQERIVLHGVREMHSYKEYDPIAYSLILANCNWETAFYVKASAYNDLDSVFAKAQTLNPREEEGYVVCDAQFNRVKVKNKDHVRRSHMQQAMTNSVMANTKKGLLKVLLAGEQSEFLTYLPQYERDYQKLEDKFNELAQKVENEWQINTKGKCNDCKIFAARIVNNPYKSILFSLYHGKVTNAKDGLRNLHLDTLLKLMGV